MGGVIPEASDLPPGSQPWKRSVDSRLLALENNINRGNQDMVNAIKALSTTVKVLGDQITALPVIQVLGDRDSNFGLTDTFTAISSVGFYAPAGKRLVGVFAGVNAAVLDTVTGGVTSAEGRLNFGGLLSPTFVAAKDAGASAVNNIISANYYWRVNLNPGGYYSIKFELRGLNPTAFPQQASNYSTISIIASHTG